MGGNSLQTNDGGFIISGATNRGNDNSCCNNYYNSLIIKTDPFGNAAYPYEN